MTELLVSLTLCFGRHKASFWTLHAAAREPPAVFAPQASALVQAPAFSAWCACSRCVTRSGDVERCSPLCGQATPDPVLHENHTDDRRSGPPQRPERSYPLQVCRSGRPESDASKINSDATRVFPSTVAARSVREIRHEGCSSCLLYTSPSPRDS